MRYRRIILTLAPLVALCAAIFFGVSLPSENCIAVGISSLSSSHPIYRSLWGQSLDLNPEQSLPHVFVVSDQNVAHLNDASAPSPFHLAHVNFDSYSYFDFASTLYASLDLNAMYPTYCRNINSAPSSSDVCVLASKRGEKIGSISGMPRFSGPIRSSGESSAKLSGQDAASPYRFGSSFMVWVETSKGGSYLVRVRPDITIFKLKEMVSSLDGSAPKDQYLTCNAKYLSDHRFIGDYFGTICEGCTIFAVMRICLGGATNIRESKENSPSRHPNKKNRTSAVSVSPASSGDESGNIQRDSNAAAKGSDIMRVSDLCKAAAAILTDFCDREDTKKGKHTRDSKQVREVADKLTDAADVISTSINGATGFKRLDRAWKLVDEMEHNAANPNSISNRRKGSIGEAFGIVKRFGETTISRSACSSRSNSCGSSSNGDASEPSLSQRRRNLRPFYVNGFPIPRPSIDDKEYSPAEVVDILDAANAHGPQNKRGTTKNCRLTKTWLLDMKLVPVTRSALDKLFCLFRDGQGSPPRKWNMTGGKQIAPLEVILGIMHSQLEARKGKTWGREDVRDALEEFRRKDALSKKLDPESMDLTPCDDTIEKFYGGLAMSGRVKFTRAARSKPRTRAAAETSLRSAVSFLMTVAASSFIIDKPPSADRSIPKKATKGILKLVDLIRGTLRSDMRSNVAHEDDTPIDLSNSDDEDSDDESVDIPTRVEDGSTAVEPVGDDSIPVDDVAEDVADPFLIYAIHKAMLFSTDDTTIFYYPDQGNEKGKSEWRLGSVEQDGKTYSFHRSGDTSSNRFKGISVRLTVTMSGAGQMAPIYATVTGLTSREIPMSIESGRVVIEVPGLCIGGSSDAYANQVGYLVLLRNDPGMEAKNFAYYSDNVRLPFVERIRKNLWDVDSPAQLTKDMTAVLWSDGGIPQLAANTNETRLASNEAKRVIECKHAAAASAIQQPCDLSPVFRVLKSKVKAMTALLDRKDRTLRSKVAKCLKEYNKKAKSTGLGEINLPDVRQNALLDLISILPEVMAKAGSQTNITRGFVESGMLDEMTETTPDFFGILNTMKRYREQWETDLVIDSFPRLLKYQIEHGHISESLFNELGFPKDKDDDGKVVERNAGIRNETCQRSKCLSHPYQRKLRQDEIDSAAAATYNAIETERLGREKVLKLNRSAEKKLHAAAGRPETSGRRHLARTSVEDLFKILGVKEMKAMIHVRECPTYNTRGKYSFPRNKGNISYANTAAEREEQGLPVLHPEDCLLYRLTKLIGRTELKMKELPHRSLSVVAAESISNNNDAVAPLLLAADGKSGSIQPSPSSFLCDSAWLALARKSLRGATYAEEVTEDMKEVADSLLPTIRTRLVAMKKDRLRGKHADKHDHWSLTWLEENLSRLCAIVALSGHVGKKSIQNAKAGSCLLRRPGKAMYHRALDEPTKSMGGCYLYYDEERGCFIRSGKVYGDNRGFTDRNDDHVEGAMNNSTSSLDSNFYSKYPSENAAEDDVSEDIKVGDFEDLVMYCGIGISDLADTGPLCAKENGLFYWDDNVIDSVKTVGFQVADLKKRQLHMVSYLSETFYDLLLSPDVNVSRSFGFETPLGIFGS